MNIKENIKTLWNYIKDMADNEEIDIKEAFEATINGFDFDESKMSDETINQLSDDEARSLLFEIGYMAVNELFGGDFETWNYTLENLGFDEETIEFLNY